MEIILGEWRGTGWASVGVGWGVVGHMFFRGATIVPPEGAVSGRAVRICHVVVVASLSRHCLPLTYFWGSDM